MKTARPEREPFQTMSYGEPVWVMEMRFHHRNALADQPMPDPSVDVPPSWTDDEVQAPITRAPGVMGRISCYALLIAGSGLYGWLLGMVQ